MYAFYLKLQKWHINLCNRSRWLVFQEVEGASGSKDTFWGYRRCHYPEDDDGFSSAYILQNLLNGLSVTYHVSLPQ